jgi:hypothetical protein
MDVDDPATDRDHGIAAASHVHQRLPRDHAALAGRDRDDALELTRREPHRAPATPDPAAVDVDQQVVGSHLAPGG